jgi:poly(3-hydroxybutyrate) depolymerase
MLLVLVACVGSAKLHAPASRTIDGRFVDDRGLSGAYRLVLPRGRAERPGVLVFFGWDGDGRAYRRMAGLLAPLADARNLVLVTLRNPGPSRCWWAPTVEENVHWVDRLVTDVVMGPIGVDPGRVIAAGLSGGADFASAFHVHTGDRYGGGAVALCGGDVPRADGGDCDTEADPPVAARAPRPDVRYFFALTADDPLLAHSLAAAAFYGGAGANVTHRVVAGEGHCGFVDGFEGLAELEAGLAVVDPR